MLRASNIFTMFMGEPMIELLSQKNKALLNTIKYIKADDFLEIDEMDLINNLVERFKVNAPQIDFENIEVSSYEKQIPAEQFPQDIFVRAGKNYPVQVIIYHLPFTGNGELFQYTPSQFMLWSPEVYIEDQNVCFEIINFKGDTEEIRRNAQRNIDAIKFFYNALLQDIGNYDTQLRDNIEQLVKARKQKIINDNGILTELGRPINKKRFPFGLAKDLPFSVESEAAPTKDESKDKAGTERKQVLADSETVKERDISQNPRLLRVFLCHSSNDKPHVRDLYKRLVAIGIEAWLDEESLLPGQTWELEISKAIRSTHVVIVCLSEHATTKRGYVQKEIKFALDEADKQPEGTIFIIPLKIEKCNLPNRLHPYHTVNLFEERGFEKLTRALRSRADELELTLKSSQI